MIFILGFFLVLMIIGYFIEIPIITTFEKRLIQPYTENIDPELPESEYSILFSKILEANGFVLHDIVKDSRGALYKALYQFYRSANGDTLAIVSCGTIVKINYEMTCLVTRFDDGTWIKSINKNCSEFDLTGLVREELFENVSTQEFLDKHNERIEQESKSKKVRIYDEDMPLIDYCGDLLRQCDLLISKGLARFRDEERTVWSYTLKGAVLVSIRTFWIGFRRADFKNQ